MPKKPVSIDPGSSSYNRMTSGKKPKKIKLTIGVRYRALVEQSSILIRQQDYFRPCILTHSSKQSRVTNQRSGLQIMTCGPK
jgi:hypothetical protein